MNNLRFSIRARSVGVFWVSTLVFVTGCQAASERETVAKETHAYYSEWIGVQAPEFGREVRNRNKGERLRIRDHQGKRLLLYGFDAGDFNKEPNVVALKAELTGLNRLRQQHTNDLAVIGFTYGVALFFPGVDPPPELKSLIEFPIVNNTNIELEEPYNLLQRWPSAILIDKNGVIIGVYPQTMTEQQLAKALSKSDWHGKLRPHPKSGPPDLVRNYSSRKPFIIYVYRQDLEQHAQFRRQFGRLGEVYLKEDVPKDAVESLEEVEGKTLRTSVRKGAPIRRRNFDN